MSFRITGLDPAPFRHLFGASDALLATQHIVRVVADRKPGYPDRIELRDCEPGETLLLLNYTHQAADTPYHACHAIYVCEGAETPFDQVDRVPEVLRKRLISLRAFNHANFMTDADVVDGRKLSDRIGEMLADPAVAYLHAHNAKQGCYAARIDRC